MQNCGIPTIYLALYMSQIIDKGGYTSNARDGYKMELTVSILNRISQADKRSK